MKKNWRSTVAVLLFFAALWTPLIGMLFGVGNFAPGDENRTLAAPSALGDAFTAYVHDHFGFRRILITAQAWFKVRVLGVSSSAEVVLGKDGWLFYAGDKSIDNHRGVLPFGGDDLGCWVKLFQRRRDWLARRGIPLIVAIVPDKIDVYPEFLPASFRRVNEQTRLNAFVAATPVLDLRPALLHAKRSGARLYSPTDTHWTARGAYAGYLAIAHEMARTYPDLQAIPYADVPPAGYGAGDLTKMLGLGTVWRDVPNDSPWPPELRVTESEDGALVVRYAAGGDRRLMMFGDSFSFRLIPYLARHFGETVVSRSPVFKPELIAQRHPDVVLFEMVERMLNLSPPPDPVDLMSGAGQGIHRRNRVEQ